MRTIKSWRWMVRKRHMLIDGGTCGVKMKQLTFRGIVCIVMLFVVYRTTYYQYLQTEIDEKLNPFYASKDIAVASNSLGNLPRGIIQARSDLELKPLWSTGSSSSKVNVSSSHNLLAIPAGIKQKSNVDAIVRKFLSENFTIILFHYDGNVDGWWDVEWSKKAIHIVAENQTKWWFAKRFLHPAVVSIYDYIFLWDEDLGVEKFHPGRFVEGMAPVFSRSAWLCAWHLIQNDLVHGWGMDMKLGYCAQGDRTEKVGVVDSEYIVHQGIQTLGGASAPKASNPEDSNKEHTLDVRTVIRKEATSELQIFKQRWERAVREDQNWVDPFRRKGRRNQRRRKQRRHI